MCKKIKQDYKNICKNRTIVWDDVKIPKNVNTKTYWKCLKCGYRWKATYDKILQKRGCPRCAHRIKKTEQDYHDLVKDRDIEWIGTIVPRTTKIKTLWKCLKCGNEWKTAYNEIYNLRECPVCAGNIPKTESDYNIAAEAIDYKWLGSELPKNIKIKTLWQCNKGHCFKMSYACLTINKNRCPVCSNHIPKIEKDYNKLAEKHNFMFDGKCLPKTTHYKTWWMCKKGGHRFKASYNNIKAGWGCPYCRDLVNGAQVSKPQRKLNTILYGSLNYPESKYRIDVAIMRKSQKIAVEYDCCYWHRGNEKHDVKRDKFLVSRGWKVLHVKSRNLVPTRKQLNNKINKLLSGKNVVSMFLRDWKS